MDIMRAFLHGFSSHMLPDGDLSGQGEPPAPEHDSLAPEIIKEPPMEIDGRVMNATEFVRYVSTLDCCPPLPTRIFLHHTWRPTPETWQGYSTMLAMKEYYEQRIWEDSEGCMHEGWTAGPHLFIAQDGIWLFSDLRYDGVGVYGHNYRSRHIEMVGNYDYELPSGAILENTIVALGILHERLGLDPRHLNFHRDFATKSCPGRAVQKEWIIPLVQAWIEAYRRVDLDALSALRRSLRRMVHDLLVPTNPAAALAKEAERRGYLGALTHEIPMEVGDEAYLVQLFADVLLVPVQKWDSVRSLREFEEACRTRGDDVSFGAKRRAPPPVDPYDFQE